MRSNEFAKAIMATLREHASAKGYTQSSLAKKLNVSLPTLKRWLAGKAVTLENLKRIADSLGVSFIDLASAIDDKEGTRFQYTVEQEEHLAKNPELLAFFDYLIRGYSPLRVKKKFSLSTVFLERCLSRLDKLGLIEWLPKNKAGLKLVGEPQWRKDGPLVKRFRDQIKSEFLNSHNTIFEKFALHDYLPEDRIKIERKLEEALELSRQAGARSTVSQNVAEASGLFISFKKFRWNLDSFLKDR